MLAGETRRTQSPVEHRRAAEPPIAKGEREEPHKLSQQEVYQQEQEHTPQHEHDIEPTSSEPTREVTPKEKPIREQEQGSLEKARSSSAPGPNGVPYKVYKNCPRVLNLWRLMRVAWETQSIPAAWSRAVTTFIPKERFLEHHPI